MLLVIDVGNTNIVLGLMDGQEVQHRISGNNHTRDRDLKVQVPQGGTEGPNGQVANT